MVRAIDVHVHPPDASGTSLTSSEETQRYFRTAAPPKSADEMADLRGRSEPPRSHPTRPQLQPGRRWASSWQCCGSF